MGPLSGDIMLASIVDRSSLDRLMMMAVTVFLVGWAIDDAVTCMGRDCSFGHRCGVLVLAKGF